MNNDALKITRVDDLVNVAETIIAIMKDKDKKYSTYKTLVGYTAKANQEYVVK